MMKNDCLGFELFNTNGIYYLKSNLLSSFNVNHLFACRFGGVSSGDFNSLNVSFSRKDRNGCLDTFNNVYENYARVLKVLNSTPEKSCAARQIHSACVKVADCCGANIVKDVGSDGEDGLILCSDNAEIETIAIKTADCVPILFYDKKSKNVAAVHAGHRGTNMKIASVCAEKMMSLSGCSFEDIYVAIGPCIGKCCYEVGVEVANNTLNCLGSRWQFEQLCQSKPNQKYMLDLAGSNKQVLVNFGIPQNNIDVCKYKTCCFEINGINAFFSHRKSGGFSGTFPTIICRNCK